MNIIEKHRPSQNPALSYNHAISGLTWVEINRAALEHNLASYKSLCPTALFAPVIKSNAYGHGIEQVALVCDQSQAVDLIAIASLSEAVYLKSLDIKKPLLVLSIIDAPLEEAVRRDISLIVYELSVVEELHRLGALYNKKVKVHVKVDTGLSRLGVYPEEAFELIKHINKLPFLTLDGVFTHLSDSESADQSFANHQIERFATLVNKLKENNININFGHTSCSAALVANKNSHKSIIRAGIGVYGLWPSQENKEHAIYNCPEFYLQPVLTWKTKIIQIKDVPAGTSIGYDRTHYVHQDARIATLPVGYWDGYDRAFSNNGKVLINNQLAPVVGRVAMNLMMIDITGLEVSLADEVILLGNHPEITADALAQRCGTINYEIVTRINPLLTRVII